MNFNEKYPLYDQFDNFDFEVPIHEYNRYFPGEKYHEQPNDVEYKNMLRLVAYDICDSKRLHKVAKVCELYGIRVEKSVFEADLAEEQFQNFWLELMDLIDETEDSVMAYQICKACVQKIEVMGNVTRPAKPLLYFI